MGIPNLTPTICPACGAVDSIVEERRSAHSVKVVGVNEDGALEYRAEEELLYYIDELSCTSCGSMVHHADIIEATLGDKEDASD